MERKLNLNDSCLEISSWARSSAWLERSTDNRKVMCSNHIGPIFNYLILSDIVSDHCKISPILSDNKSELILVFLEILPHNASLINF